LIYRRAIAPVIFPELRADLTGEEHLHITRWEQELLLWQREQEQRRQRDIDNYWRTQKHW